MPVFVDTNIFLYALDSRDKRKQTIAQEWISRCWRERAGRTSIQVINEFYVNLVRLGGPSYATQAREEARLLFAWQPRALDEATLEAAWTLQTQASLSHWDALVLASAKEQGCDLLLTEDMQTGRRIDGIEIRNPFVA